MAKTLYRDERAGETWAFETGYVYAPAVRGMDHWLSPFAKKIT
jgi:hypothetical protein